MASLIKLCPKPPIDYSEGDINATNFEVNLNNNLNYILKDAYFLNAIKGIDLELIKKEMSNCKECLSKGILIDTMKDFLDIHAKRSGSRIKNCTKFDTYNDKDVSKPLSDKLQSIQDTAEKKKDADMITCYSGLNSLVYNIISDVDANSRAKKYRERFPEFCSIDFTPIGTLYKDVHGNERRLSDEARQITGVCSDFDSGGDCIPGNISTNVDMPEDIGLCIINIAISVLKSVLTPLDDINIKIKKAPISQGPKTFELHIEGLSSHFLIKTGACGYFTVDKLTSAIYPDLASEKAKSSPDAQNEVRAFIHELLIQLNNAKHPSVSDNIIRKKVLCLLMCIKTAGDFIKMFVVYILNRFNLIPEKKSGSGIKLNTIDNIYFLTHDKSAMNLALCLNIHCLGGTGSATKYNSNGTSIRFLYWDSIPKWYRTNFKRKLTGLGYKFIDKGALIINDNINIEQLVNEEDKLDKNNESSSCPEDVLCAYLNGGMPAKKKTVSDKTHLAEIKEKEDDVFKANRTADRHLAENEHLSSIRPRSRQLMSIAIKSMARDFKNKTPNKKTGEPLYSAKSFNEKSKIIARFNTRLLSRTIRNDPDFHFARINLQEDYETLNAAIITAMITPDINEARQLILEKRKEPELKGYTRSKVLPSFLELMNDASYMERYLSINAEPNDTNKTISIELFYNKCLIQSLNRKIASVSSRITLTFQNTNGTSATNLYNLFKNTISKDDKIIEDVSNNEKIKKNLAIITKNFVNTILDESRTCCLAFVNALRLVDYLDPSVDIPYYTSEDYNLLKSKKDYIERLNDCMKDLVRVGKHLHGVLEERDTQNKGRHNCGEEAKNTLQKKLPQYISNLEICIKIYSELNKRYREIYTYVLKIIELYNKNEKNASNCLTLIYLCETLLILVKFLCKLKIELRKINDNIIMYGYTFFIFEVDCVDENVQDRNNPKTRKLINKIKDNLQEFFQGDTSLNYESNLFLHKTENDAIHFISINGSNGIINGIKNLLPIVIEEFKNLRNSCREFSTSEMQLKLQNFSDVSRFKRNPTVGGKYKKNTSSAKKEKPKVKKDVPIAKKEKLKVKKVKI